jgi:hypothetical protein
MKGSWGTRLAALCMLALASGCTGTHPDAVPAQGLESLPAAAENFSCTRAEAKTVKLAALRRHPEQFANQCIRVALFTDGVDFAENAGALHAPWPKPFKFFFDDRAARLPKSPSFVDLVARVRACDAGVPKTCLDGAYVSDVRILPTAMD